MPSSEDKDGAAKTTPTAVPWAKDVDDLESRFLKWSRSFWTTPVRWHPYNPFGNGRPPVFRTLAVMVPGYVFECTCDVRVVARDTETGKVAAGDEVSFVAKYRTGAHALAGQDGTVHIASGASRTGSGRVSSKRKASQGRGSDAAGESGEGGGSGGGGGGNGGGNGGAAAGNAVSGPNLEASAAAAAAAAERGSSRVVAKMKGEYTGAELPRIVAELGVFGPRAQDAQGLRGRLPFGETLVKKPKRMVRDVMDAHRDAIDGSPVDGKGEMPNHGDFAAAFEHRRPELRGVEKIAHLEDGAALHRLSRFAPEDMEFIRGDLDPEVPIYALQHEVSAREAWSRSSEDATLRTILPLAMRDARERLGTRFSDVRVAPRVTGVSLLGPSWHPVWLSQVHHAGGLVTVGVDGAGDGDASGKPPMSAVKVGLLMHVPFMGLWVGLWAASRARGRKMRGMGAL